MSFSTSEAAQPASAPSHRVKHTGIASIVFAVTMLLTGIFVFAAVLRLSHSGSMVVMGLLLLGTAFSLFGLYRLFLLFLFSEPSVRRKSGEQV